MALSLIKPPLTRSTASVSYQRLCEVPNYVKFGGVRNTKSAWLLGYGPAESAEASHIIPVIEDALGVQALQGEADSAIVPRAQRLEFQELVREYAPAVEYARSDDHHRPVPWRALVVPASHQTM